MTIYPKKFLAEMEFCKIDPLSMKGMSPVAPVLLICFHRLEIMKFQDHKNPAQETFSLNEAGF
jgi:hypothetical protein